MSDSPEPKPKTEKQKDQKPADQKPDGERQLVTTEGTPEDTLPPGALRRDDEQPGGSGQPEAGRLTIVPDLEDLGGGIVRGPGQNAVDAVAAGIDTTGLQKKTEEGKE